MTTWASLSCVGDDEYLCCKVQLRGCRLLHLSRTFQSSPRRGERPVHTQTSNNRFPKHRTCRGGPSARPSEAKRACASHEISVPGSKRGGARWGGPKGRPYTGWIFLVEHELLIRNQWQLHKTLLSRSVINALHSFPINLRLGPEDRWHKRLRVAVIEWEPA